MKRLHLSPSLVTGLVFAASTVVWIAGISATLVYFLGLSAVVGWWIAGSLGFSSAVAMTVLLYEMNHAMETDRVEGDGGFEDFADPLPWSFFGRGPMGFLEA